jgi:hypothetical protein
MSESPKKVLKSGRKKIYTNEDEYKEAKKKYNKSYIERRKKEMEQKDEKIRELEAEIIKLKSINY